MTSMFYTEKERKIEIKDTADVIVVGSGPAGVAAAIAAKKDIDVRNVNVEEIQKALV